MNCTCGGETKVTDTRNSVEGTKRRRVCLKCNKRFNTVEIEMVALPKKRGPKPGNKPTVFIDTCKVKPKKIAPPSTPVRDLFTIAFFGEKK